MSMLLSSAQLISLGEIVAYAEFQNVGNIFIDINNDVIPGNYVASLIIVNGINTSEKHYKWNLLDKSWSETDENYKELSH